MFERLRFKLAVRRIRRDEKRQLEAINWKTTARAEALPKAYNIEEEARDQIDYFYTQYLFKQLDKLQLPRPELNEQNWVGSSHFNAIQYLSKSAIAEARDAIRKERKERSEIARLWVGSVAPVVSAFTGLIGALIGLLAYLLK